MFKVYAMIWKQCSKAMQIKISNTLNFESEIKNNPIKLLNIIWASAIKTQECEYDCFVIYKSLYQLVTIRMSAEESSNEFSDQLEVTAEYIEAETGEPITFINLMAPATNIKAKDID
jgi:hypothetical protein